MRTEKSAVTRSIGAAVVCASSLWLAGTASAISITTVYNPGASGGNSVSPSFDPFGNQLADIFEYVDAFYTDIYQDSGHSLTVNFWYQDLANNSLGNHDWVSEDANDRENVANIKIDTNLNTGGTLRNYFFDPTPEDDDEFEMQQTLWRDVNATDRNDWFNFGTNIPETFEVGFTGNAVNGDAADGAIDMLSLVLHEVGHALGMSGSATKTQNEAGVDNDYDFDPDFIFGRTLAADTLDRPTDFIGHIDAGPAGMRPGLNGSFRRHMSHTDFFTMASSQEYTNIDVPRREFYGDSVGDGIGSWNTDAHWSGNNAPDFNDDVFVRAAQTGTTMTAFLTANASARNLNISEGANVDTQAFLLNISGDVTITDFNTDVLIDPGGELQADQVFIQNQAEVAMSGGELDARRVVIDAGTQLRAYDGGSATVQISQTLINNGTLTSVEDSLLYFSTTTPTPWDLDGTSGDGSINASNGRVWFDTGAMTDAFDGEVTVGAGQFFRFDAPWIVGASGVLDLNGGATEAERARILGGQLTMNGAAEIEASGEVDFDSAVVLGSNVNLESVGVPTNVEFNSTADLDGTDFTLRTGAQIDFNGTTDVSGTSSVSTINNINSTLDPRIEFNAQTNYSSYTLNESGSADLVIQQNGNAQFVGTTTINAHIFDMDGAAGNTVLMFGDGVNNGSLVLNVDGIETSGSTYNGTLDLDNGGFTSSLTVNLTLPNFSWTMSGTADLAGNVIAYLDRIKGSRMRLGGTMQVSALVGIDADVDFLSSGTVEFANASSGLAVRGLTTVAAGTTFTGGGTLDVQSTGSLVMFDNAALGTSDLRNRGVLEIAGTTDASVNDFDQTGTGRWNVDLGGSNSTLYDVLVSDGDVDIAGMLGLTLTGGYVPNLYTTTHTILNGIFSSTLDGVFWSIDGVVQNGFGLAVLYTAQDIQVRAALLGDANLSGQVEQGDLDAILQNWGMTAQANGISWITGDLNGNGQVEQGDLDQVLQNWGSAAAPDFRGFVVPEPNIVVAMLVGCVGIARRRRLL